MEILSGNSEVIRDLEYPNLLCYHHPQKNKNAYFYLKSTEPFLEPNNKNIYSNLCLEPRLSLSASRTSSNSMTSSASSSGLSASQVENWDAYSPSSTNLEDDELTHLSVRELNQRLLV